MIQKKVLEKNQVLDFFKVYFRSKGFLSGNSPWNFIKKNEAGFDSIIVSIAEYESDFVMEFHLGKRINQIENFAGAFLNYSDVYSSYSMSMFSSFARLRNENYQRFSIKNFNDLSLISNHLNDFLKNRGFRVLEQWSSLINLNHIYNEDPYSMNMFYNHYSKAVRGIIINKFIGDERYELLYQVYKSILLKNSVPEDRMNNFERLNSFLSIYSPN